MTIHVQWLVAITLASLFNLVTIHVLWLVAITLASLQLGDYTCTVVGSNNISEPAYLGDYTCKLVGRNVVSLTQ